MKIAYLHGLESSVNPNSPKIKWLNSNFDQVYSPVIDYKQDNMFNDILEHIKRINPDYIVGSSMGGYFTYLIGSILGIETVLFNPAVIGRPFDPVVDLTGVENKSKHNLFLGENDNVIKGSEIIKFFKESDLAESTVEYYKGEHRVPVDVFTASIKKVSGIMDI